MQFLSKNAQMRITYDAVADAAYISLADEIGPGTAVVNIPVDEAPGVIVLDFDSKNRLIGVEVAHAAEHLHPDALKAADRIS